MIKVEGENLGWEGTGCMTTKQLLLLQKLEEISTAKKP